MGIHRSRGQTLVEVAVILPIVCIGIVVTVQIIASCHNAVLLQRMAFETSRDLSSDSSPRPLYGSGYRLWGRGVSPLRSLSTEIPNPWRPFNALSRVTEAGHLSSITIQSLLLPTGGFGRFLPIIHQQATAEALIEPPAPEDD